MAKEIDGDILDGININKTLGKDESDIPESPQSNNEFIGRLPTPNSDILDIINSLDEEEVLDKEDKDKDKEVDSSEEEEKESDTPTPTPTPTPNSSKEEIKEKEGEEKKEEEIVNKEDKVEDTVDETDSKAAEEDKKTSDGESELDSILSDIEDISDEISEQQGKVSEEIDDSGSKLLKEENEKLIIKIDALATKLKALEEYRDDSAKENSSLSIRLAEAEANLTDREDLSYIINNIGTEERGKKDKMSDTLLDLYKEINGFSIYDKAVTDKADRFRGQGQGGSDYGFNNTMSPQNGSRSANERISNIVDNMNIF